MKLLKKIRAWLVEYNSCRYDRCVRDKKSLLFSNIKDNDIVVEIGAGTGVNIKYYPEGVSYVAIEPNEFMYPYFLKKIGGLKVRLIKAAAENLPLEDGSADIVVSTLVLCSVNSVEVALQEVKRVLKPEGWFLFLEHVAAPRGTLLRFIQKIAKPIWKLIGDGCDPEKETLKLLSQYFNVEYGEFEVSVALIASPHIIGLAKRKE